MISRCFLYIVVAVALVFDSSGRADVYTVVARGSTMAPSRSADVAMDSESVVVEVGGEEHGYCVAADFVLRNTSDARIACDVAFPYDSLREARAVRPTFRVAVSTPDGPQPVAGVTLKQSASRETGDRSPYEFPAALCWHQTWEPHEVKTVHLTYVIGQPELYHGVVDGWRLRYMVRTGALWKGPIGRADFTFRLKGNWLGETFATAMLSGRRSSTGNVEGSTVTCSYPENARRISPLEVHWHFENWVPSEEIWLGQLTWYGYRESAPRFLYATIWGASQSYTGDTEDYTDAKLAQVVDGCFAPWRDLFPGAAKRDREGMKAIVAEWLYHEIFARHGDGFYIGHEGEGKPEPADAVGTENGAYFSPWRERFPQTTTKAKGWYKPDTGPGPHGRVRMSDLSEQERRNVAFLLHYFTPHCSCHRTGD